MTNREKKILATPKLVRFAGLNKALVGIIKFKLKIQYRFYQTESSLGHDRLGCELAAGRSIEVIYARQAVDAGWL